MSAKTATEVLAELERRKREDPAYRMELERLESERAERARLLRVAEMPVVDCVRRRDIPTRLVIAWTESLDGRCASPWLIHMDESIAPAIRTHSNTGREAGRSGTEDWE